MFLHILYKLRFRELMFTFQDLSSYAQSMGVGMGGGERYVNKHIIFNVVII